MEKKPYVPLPIQNTLKFLGVIALTVALFFLLIKSASVLIPFVIALLVSQLMEPFIRFLIRKLKIKRTLGSIIAGTLFFGVILVLAIVAIIAITNEITSLIIKVPTYVKDVSVFFDDLMTKLDANKQLLLPEALNMLENIFSSALGALAQGAKLVAFAVMNGILAFPRVLISIIITVIATFLIMTGREGFSIFCKKQFPQGVIDTFITLKNNLFNASFAYINAQIKIILFVFVALIIGFQFVDMDYKLLIAIITAIVDALPFFGAGLLLIPSAIISFIMGNISNGIAYTILYFTIIIMRQMLEPRFVSNQIGLHPLLTLVSMYAGLKLLGIVGVLIGPLLIIILTNISKSFLNGRTLKEYIYKDS